jgi:cell wall-associated NlpC family hydrolase
MKTTDYFESDQRRATLGRVARSWIGTPFIPQAAIRGAGVDCVHLVGEILVECGQIPSYSLPGYTMDGGQHSGRSLAVEWLSTHPDFLQNVNATGWDPGTVLVFRFDEASQAHHVAIALGGGSVISALPRYGVRLRTLRERYWTDRVVASFTPLEVWP